MTDCPHLNLELADERQEVKIAWPYLKGELTRANTVAVTIEA